MLYPHEYSEIDREQWNSFVSSQAQPEVMQAWEWGNAKSGFPAWTAKRLGWERDGELVALAQVLRRTLPLGFSLLYVPRGPLMDWRDKMLVHDVLNSLVGWLSRARFAAGALFLRVEPPAAPNDVAQHSLLAAGFRPYFKTIQPSRTWFIDLGRELQELFGACRRTARNLIRRCEKEKVTVEVHRGDGIAAHLREFYRLYAETARRASFGMRGFRHFELVNAEFAPRDMLRLYRCLDPDGVPLASGLVTVLNSSAWYIWGGSIRGHPMAKFASYGYVWAMLRDLQQSGIKRFDFWGLAPDDGSSKLLSEGAQRSEGSSELVTTDSTLAPRQTTHPWAGFSLFKRAFDGRAFDYMSAFDLPLSPLYPVFKLTDRLITSRYRATSS
jgi:lipid II:glycine glycyltransferase (peptidoglycan interpeptide bridge formation enzyme)